MNAITRIEAEAGAAWRSFVRRRTAVFFTFGFPLIIVAIFGTVIQTSPTGSGLLNHPVGYYVSGYLATIVLFTPMTRIGISIARHRNGQCFEKLATTPLTQFEWLAAHTLVNVVLVLGASAIVIGVLELFTRATIVLSPMIVPFIVLAAIVFCGFGAVLSRITDSQDGVVAASNAIALPLVFLSETFVPPEMLPDWFRPAVHLSPLTYFARGVRDVLYLQDSSSVNLLVLAGLAVLFFVGGVYAIPPNSS